MRLIRKEKVGSTLEQQGESKGEYERERERCRTMGLKDDRKGEMVK